MPYGVGAHSAPMPRPCRRAAPTPRPCRAHAVLSDGVGAMAWALHGRPCSTAWAWRGSHSAPILFPCRAHAEPNTYFTFPDFGGPILTESLTFYGIDDIFSLTMIKYRIKLLINW